MGSNKGCDLIFMFGKFNLFDDLGNNINFGYFMGEGEGVGGSKRCSENLTVYKNTIFEF